MNGSILGGSWFINVNRFRNNDDARFDALDAFEYRDHIDLSGAAGAQVARGLACSRRGRHAIAKHTARATEACAQLPASRFNQAA